jgi:hypothetical protein
MTAADADDLGFTWRVQKSGEIQVRHHGRRAMFRSSVLAADWTAQYRSTYRF